jgi:hypothetical protein
MDKVGASLASLGKPGRGDQSQIWFVGDPQAQGEQLTAENIRGLQQGARLPSGSISGITTPSALEEMVSPNGMGNGMGLGYRPPNIMGMNMR